MTPLRFDSSLPSPRFAVFIFFFFDDTATTEIYTLSLHDALPISPLVFRLALALSVWTSPSTASRLLPRSEEHTSELQSHVNLVCRLLLEKKKKKVRSLDRRDIVLTLDCSGDMT